MHHCSNYQMEFSNLPERNGPAPVENVREFQETLAGLLSTQTQQQRVETCQKLIAEAYCVHSFYVVSDPTRIEACETNRVRFGRKVVLGRESIIETILTALAIVAARCQLG